MHLFKRLFIAAGVLATATDLSGQTPDLYPHKVKGLGEFIARFNGDELAPLNTLQGDSARVMNIVQLFDMADRPQGWEREALEFAETCAVRAPRLSLTDSTYVALAHSRVAYKGVEYPLSILLRMEPYGDGYYRWAMIGADGLFPAIIQEAFYAQPVSPTDNELNFMELDSFLEGYGDALSSYRGINAPYDQLSALMALMQTGQLEWKGVDNVSYYFFGVPGYLFTVRHFLRDSTNAGWLIDNFTKADDSMKEGCMRFLSGQKFLRTPSQK